MKRSPVYLFIVGVAGVVAALGFLIIATPSTARAIDECLEKAGSDRQVCFAETIEARSSQGDITKAFELLAASYRADPEFAANCHGNVHEIGKDAYDYFKSTRTVEPSPLASYCGYGYYHGFMEELVSLTGDMDEARRFCKQAGGGTSDFTAHESACYHGIGHGTVDGTDPRVWGDAQRLIEGGLSLCTQVSLVEHERHLCASGVFNSLGVMYPDPKYKLSYEKDDPYAICRAQREEYERNACYEQMNTLIDRLAGRDIRKALEFTKAIPTERGRAQGIEGLMFTIATHQPTHSSKEVVEVCQTLTPTLAEWCIRGYGVGLAEFGEPGQEYKESLAFCRSHDLRDNERTQCFWRTLNYLNDLYPASEFSALCKREVPVAYQQNLCS